MSKLIVLYAGECKEAIDYTKTEGAKLGLDITFAEVDTFVRDHKLCSLSAPVAFYLADDAANPEETPAGAKEFYNRISGVTGKPLCKTCFAVLGLGDAKKANYITFAKRVNSILQDKGATAFTPMGDSDKAAGVSGLEKWIPSMLSAAAKGCKCGDNCKCTPDNKCCPECTCNTERKCCCKCTPEHKCCPECTCKPGCKCCPNCKCGNDCKCTPDNKCCPACTCKPGCKCCANCKCGDACCCCCCKELNEETRIKLSLEARDRARANKSKFVEVCQDVYWIGAVDWNIRDFHGIETLRGSSYNCYLILGPNPTIVDSVKAPFAGVMLANLRALIDPALVRYIVCNHAEQDHSSAMPDVVAVCPNAEILCNKKCMATLPLLYRGTAEREKFTARGSWNELFAETCHNTHDHGDARNWKYKEIKSGQTFKLADDQTLWFIDTPMVHWPESMFTYLLEQRCLFSIDAFGQHIGCVERFDDELALYGKNPTLSDLVERLHSFYANILPPFGKLIVNVLGKFVTEVAKVEIVHDADRTLPRIIATAHGIIWRKHVELAVSLYSRWASGTVLPKVVVLYDTMYGATERMARAIGQGAHDYVNDEGKKAEVIILKASEEHVTRSADEGLDAACFAVGSPTFNTTYLPTLGSHLELIKGFKYQGRKGLAFGSYGWAPVGQRGLNAMLKDCGLEPIMDPISVQFSVTEEVLKKCYDAGMELAKYAVAKGVPYTF